MRRLVALAVCGAVVAAGCSGGTGGEAVPTSESVTPGSSASNPELPHSGAPEVTNPVPESALSAGPCEALTKQQIKQALGDGAAQGRSGENEVGPYCDWSDPATGGGFLLAFSTNLSQGLSAYYANTKAQTAIFREVDPIGGLPAVEYKDSEDDIQCGLAVGLSNEYAIDIQVTLSRANEGNDACEPAKTVATWVVANFKGE
ncbi:DUF3558 domain-containing protein [Prauserella cavernicola]|uniref:DUF3558 domain-containing protein n=1 Tax=Prauserella cavernicola TaxID=2800127 RepID=A0A934QXY4_9PSEU|nr:DUF3558 domain-containing protein [Prauserella cavernicola]MBK1788511.1 DUF3558 domain-containing protein [Prauserella cavernicola]